MHNNRIHGIGLLFVFITLLIAAVIGIIIYSGQETTNFQGFAESNETTINTEIPVSIKKVLVMEGDTVQEGQKLAEFESQDLAFRIATIRTQLLQLEAKKGMSKAEIQSKILQNKAAERAVISELNSQIKTLENQLKINKELSGGLKSVKIKRDDSAKNPIEIQIEALESVKEERRKEFAETNRMYKRMLSEDYTPENIETQKLTEELESLEKKNSDMALYAPFSGIIGSVFNKNGNGERVFLKGGEKVAAYSPVMSIINKEPSFVKGYIPESHFSAIKVGETVTITSSNNKTPISGIVTGLGGRIIPLPTRLLKNQNIPLWGREIVVKIPENNGFILGEKVNIAYGKNVWDNIARALFSTSISELAAKEPYKKKLNKSRNDTDPTVQTLHETSLQNGEGNSAMIGIVSDEPLKIEASGAVFVPETGKFIVVSDETEKKQPLLFEVGLDGLAKRIKIKNLDKINDIESIAKEADGSYLVMSSMSYSKKGKLKAERRILASFTLTNGKAELKNAVDFYEILKDFAEKSESTAADFLKKGIMEKSIDAEGMFVIEDSLFIAFKDPLFAGNGVIFEISDYKKIFSENRISENQIKVIFIEDLPKDLRISGIYMISKDTFYFTASCVDEKCGGFFKFENGRSSLIRNFSEIKPEGIAVNGNGEFFIFFDLGQKENSKFMNLGKI
ncbi:HlyD family efflux transporter periplasmic adaptor subunit [bacterium]|nr:HlyD family efflux transporter periplasmic adaptor subunit [bacterium]